MQEFLVSFKQHVVINLVLGCLIKEDKEKEIKFLKKE